MNKIKQAYDVSYLLYLLVWWLWLKKTIGLVLASKAMYLALTLKKLALNSSVDSHWSLTDHWSARHIRDFLLMLMSRFPTN